MPKILLPQTLDPLIDKISQNSAGIGVNALFAVLQPPMPRRTLQRNLARLVGQGQIVTKGEGRALRYFRATSASALSGGSGANAGVSSGAQVDTPLREHIVSQPPPSPYVVGAQVVVSKPERFYVAISPEGEEVRAAVRQPRHLRKPVAYQQAFLEAYHPNVTAYLSPVLCEQLHTLGRSPAALTPAGTFARDILNRLLIDLSWASSQLEGNTYSRLDTERLIEFGQAAEGKDTLETQMILNHKDAIEYLVRDPERASLTPDTVIALHALLSDGLLADPLACGRIRTRGVEIGGSVYLPIAMAQRLEELFPIVVNMAAEIDDPFEQAFFLMVHLPYLQAFEDMNKRTSRLAANIPFIRHNLCPLSFLDVAQQDYVDGLIGVYELNRVELLRDVFVGAYERSCQQYVAVKQSLVPPDTFRLRYRQALGAVVAAIVRSGGRVTVETIRAHIPVQVVVADHQPFIALVMAEFKSLHSGNIVRFGLRPLEFAAWLETTSASK